MRTLSPLSAIRAIAVGLVLTASAACGPYRTTGVGFSVLFVDPAPPPARVEVIAVRPGPEFVWVRGYWGWEPSGYVWVPGRWERPPRHHARWAPGYWRHERRGWYWVPGRWR